jgi:ATP phosphoribosyltransferase regulatory subunit
VSSNNRWLLPDGVDELLPREALQLEQLRRGALDLFAVWGYQLCMPPFVEFLDSLLSGVGEDLELQTFKVTDQISGRMMGIPADITPQIARIDAHRLATANPQRLCYAGPILHTRPDKFAGSRNPYQIGAELYGHAGVESDAEVVCLMLELIARSGVPNVTLELAHMDVWRGLIGAAGISAEVETDLRDALLRKAKNEFDEVLTRVQGKAALKGCFDALLQLNGEDSMLTTARSLLKAAPASVQSALDTLQGIIEHVKQRCPTVAIHIDLAELRGYRYHTGVLFAAYTPALGRAVAWGGRYDNVGAYFGAARPATGFSTDLKLLASLSKLSESKIQRVFAPTGIEAALVQAILTLRASGRVVIQQLPGQPGGAHELGCTQRLVLEQGQWQVREAKS